MGNREAIESVFTTINVVWPTARLDIRDGPTVEVWANALHGLSASVIGDAVTKLARSEDKFRPSPGQFRRLCGDVIGERKRRASAREASQAHHALANRDARQIALGACEAAFANRYAAQCGVPISLPFAWETDFDVDSVVDHIPFPATSDLEEHQQAFESLRSLFSRVWDQQFETAAGAQA